MLSTPARSTTIESLSEEYLAALIAGDNDAASEIIQRSFRKGIDLQSIYLLIICAAQRKLGDLWVLEKVSTAQEHIATEISMTQLAWLRFKAPKRAPLNLSAVVAMPIEEQHILPARVVADLFLLDGWTVHFPGLNTPDADLIAFIEDRKIDLVAFSLTMSPSKSFLALLKRIKKLSAPPYIVVGGAGAGNLTDISEIDLCAPQSISSIKHDPRFLGPKALEAGFAQLKSELGERITALRQERHLNQQQLSTLAQIDRAYLSALENGKQNPSLLVFYRLATALGVSCKELLGK